MENWHLRQLESIPFYEAKVPRQFASMVDQRVLQDLPINGYHKDRKLDLLTTQLFTLVCAGLNGQVVADSRNNRNADTRSRVQMWNLLESHGWLIKCSGSETSRKVTRYQATDKLLSVQDVWTPDLLSPTKLVRNSSQLSRPSRNALVVIQTKVKDFDGDTFAVDRKALSFSGFPEDMPLLREAENRLERINQRNATYDWRLQHQNDSMSAPSIRLKQVHVDRPGNGTRLYTFGPHSVQHLRKELRLKIRIDDRPVCEPDYSGMMIRLLYHHFCRISGPQEPESRDIYAPDRIFPELLSTPAGILEHDTNLRNLVKDATLICINCSSRELAHSAVSNRFLNAAWSKTKSFEQALAILRNSPDSKPVIELVNRIMDLHPVASRYFFQGLGLQLMTIESTIMLDILDTMTEAGKPAIGIHDAVLCRREDEDYVKRRMYDVYRDRMGFYPVIK
jgi:hypothetical protein